MDSAEFFHHFRVLHSFLPCREPCFLKNWLIFSKIQSKLNKIDPNSISGVKIFFSQVKTPKIGYFHLKNLTITVVACEGPKFKFFQNFFVSTCCSYPKEGLFMFRSWFRRFFDILKYSNGRSDKTKDLFFDLLFNISSLLDH